METPGAFSDLRVSALHSSFGRVVAGDGSPSDSGSLGTGGIAAAVGVFGSRGTSLSVSNCTAECIIGGDGGTGGTAAFVAAGSSSLLSAVVQYNTVARMLGGSARAPAAAGGGVVGCALNCSTLSCRCASNSWGHGYAGDASAVYGNGGSVFGALATGAYMPSGADTNHFASEFPGNGGAKGDDGVFEMSACLHPPCRSAGQLRGTQ